MNENGKKRKKQSDLENIIRELSKKLYPDINQYKEKLVEVYKDGYRHTYSSITALILKIEKTEDESIENICQNLSEIIDVLEEDSGCDQNLLKQIEKLMDHISLEDVRLKARYSEQQKAMSIMDKALEANNGLLSEAKVILEQSKSLKVEVVTILSIFAAILLTFVSGISFTSSVLETMNSTTIYRVCFVSIIVGVIIFNTIGVLLYMVSKIADKSIYTNCKTNQCTCTPVCGSLNRIRNRMPYVFYFNLFAGICLVIIVAMWFVDFSGIRVEFISNFIHK